MLTRFQWGWCIRSPDPVVIAEQRGACLELLVRNVRPVQDLEGINVLHWVCGLLRRACWFVLSSDGGSLTSVCVFPSPWQKVAIDLIMVGGGGRQEAWQHAKLRTAKTCFPLDVLTHASPMFPGPHSLHALGLYGS